MSHFLILACLPSGSQLGEIDALLAEALEPWNENRAVDPYRRYEQSEPGQFWAVPALRHHGWALPEPGLSWVQVAAAYNSEYGQADNDQLLIDEHDRAYTISTRNPKSRWDWWVIGGRWPRHLIAVAGATADQLIGAVPIGAVSGTVNDRAHRGFRRHCAGGPRRLLDFTAMRDTAHAHAQARYDRWEALCAQTPPARSWSQMSHLVHSGDLTIEQARERYQAQPRIIAAHHAGLADWLGCPIDEFGADRDCYLAQARHAAVPGYALLTLDQQWIAPGEAGWWGTSSDGPADRASYHRTANTYLGTLDPDALVIVVDCHI